MDEVIAGALRGRQLERSDSKATTERQAASLREILSSRRYGPRTSRLSSRNSFSSSLRSSHMPHIRIITN